MDAAVLQPSEVMGLMHVFMFQGIEPSIRALVWPFLLGV
jgi:hypothetical protein